MSGVVITTWWLGLSAGTLSTAQSQALVFDAGLAQAVQAFKRNHQLDVDDVVGRQTLAQLRIPPAPHTAIEITDYARHGLDGACAHIVAPAQVLIVISHHGCGPFTLTAALTAQTPVHGLSAKPLPGYRF